MRWIDRLWPHERAELRDAGRIGNSRFATEGEYARHIANPELVLLVKQRVGANQFGDPVVVLINPGPEENRRYYSGELIFVDGHRIVAAVNEYGAFSTAWSNAMKRCHTTVEEVVL